MNVHLVTVLSAHLRNTLKTVSQAGFKVSGAVYGLLALGEMLLTPAMKERGVALIDLGGKSISLGVYYKGAIRHSRELPFGSDFITRDLAVGLKTSIATAEHIKQDYGIAHPSLFNGDADIECLGIDAPIRVKTSDVMNIILPRVEEIFSTIAKDLQNTSYADEVAPGGVVLTGGGSLLRGMAEVAQEHLDMPVHVGRAIQTRVVCDERWLSPIYTTALGLLSHSTGLSEIETTRLNARETTLPA
jgi:cell division protein FtsA